MQTSSNSGGHHHPLSAAGVIVTLGIIYGDIGTSPLYAIKAIVGNNIITEDLILGGISAVFWTITILTTIKYVFFTLQADNKGEGGILSLFALIKRKRKKSYLIFVAMIGAAMMLADGIITPPISVASAIEGLRFFDSEINTLPYILIVICGIFLFQQLGTSKVGKSFGPIMFVWFSTLAMLGLYNIVKNPFIFKALNPYYAVKLITTFYQDPNTMVVSSGFWMLGAVFLCTTGAEALFADLGHVGKANIRYSWAFVKTCLLLNYFGQGAWLSGHIDKTLNGINPLFGMVPNEGVRVYLIILACVAAVIASQATITGSFSIISEAIRLNIFPKIEVKYPSDSDGQVFIPFINTILFIGCVAVVLFFRESTAMEAAYGLAIALTMMMTTILLREFFIVKRHHSVVIVGLTTLFLGLESMFFLANLVKFLHGGYVTFGIAALFVVLMFSRYRTTRIKKALREFVPINTYKDQLMELSHDTSQEKFATNLVFMTTSPKEAEVENKVFYSILHKQPKRADNYWFVHVHVTRYPFTCEYKVDEIVKNDIYRITFYLGFKVEEKISQFLKQVVEDMVKRGEITNIDNRYHLVDDEKLSGDFKFLMLEEELSTENDLGFWDRLAIQINLWFKSFTASPEKWFNIDKNLLVVEKVPLVIKQSMDQTLVRLETKPNY
jgi:KUP system potassium uptake protein